MQKQYIFLLFATALSFILVGLHNASAQSACPTDAMYPHIADWTGNGYPDYRFYRIDGTHSTSFAVGETIYYYASGSTRQCIGSTKTLTTKYAILPPEATTICTMSKDWHYMVASGVGSFTAKACPKLGTDQYTFGTIQHFSFATPGSYTIAFANSTENRVITVSNTLTAPTFSYSIKAEPSNWVEPGTSVVFYTPYVTYHYLYWTKNDVWVAGSGLYNTSTLANLDVVQAMVLPYEGIQAYHPSNAVTVAVGSAVATATATTVCPGSTAALSVSVTGALPPYSYSWTAPVGTTLNATSASAVTASIQVGETGVKTFSVLVTDSSPTPLTTSASVSVTLAEGPTLTSQPATASLVCQGTAVSVPVSATGSNLSYQWYKDGTALNTQTSASLSLPAATTADSGSYLVVVANSLCPILSLTSTAFSLTVSEQPALVASPFPATVVCQGTALQLPLTVTGAVSAFQWYQDGQLLGGQTSATLTLPNAATTDSGSYQLVAQSSVCNSLTSTAIGITVSEAVAIIQQPATASVVCAGAGVGVSVPVSTTGANATFQWYKDTTPLGKQTAATLLLASPAVTNSGIYSLVVTGGCNSVTSTAFSLTVSSIPSVSIQPSTAFLPTAGQVTLVAQGADSYSWNTGTTSTTLTDSPTSSTVYSVTGIRNGCMGTATARVMVGCGDLIQSDAISVTQTAVLGPSNCSVTLLGAGYGTGYTITGPERSDASGYVFSAVYRKVGYYTLRALDVKRPGTYTFTVVYADACGERSRDTMTYVVTGTACQ